VKNKGGLVEMSIRIIHVTFIAPVYFLTGGDRRSGYTSDGWLKKEEEPSVKHIASGNFVAGG